MGVQVPLSAPDTSIIDRPLSEGRLFYFAGCNSSGVLRIVLGAHLQAGGGGACASEGGCSTASLTSKARLPAQTPESLERACQPRVQATSGQHDVNARLDAFSVAIFRLRLMTVRGETAGNRLAICIRGFPDPLLGFKVEHRALVDPAPERLLKQAPNPVRAGVRDESFAIRRARRWRARSRLRGQPESPPRQRRWQTGHTPRAAEPADPSW